MKKADPQNQKEEQILRLVAAAQEGNQEAETTLLREYKGLVKSKARAFYILGADKEDVVQEGMIGLYKAIQRFDKEGGASFTTYASTCIERQILDAIKAATRKKHEPLNTSLSLNEEAPRRKAEATAAGQEPTEGVGRAMDADSLADLLEGEWRSRFSEMEYTVLKGRLAGKTLTELAEDKGKPYAAVHNAMERAKRKIRGLMNR